MKQKHDKRIRVISLIANGASIKQIKILIDMNEESNEDYYQFIKKTLEKDEYQKYLAKCLLAKAAHQLSVEDMDYLPF